MSQSWTCYRTYIAAALIYATLHSNLQSRHSSHTWLPHCVYSSGTPTHAQFQHHSTASVTHTLTHSQWCPDPTSLNCKRHSHTHTLTHSLTHSQWCPASTSLNCKRHSHTHSLTVVPSSNITQLQASLTHSLTHSGGL